MNKLRLVQLGLNGCADICMCFIK